MARKTINVDFIKAFANEQLARTDEAATKEFKMGICVMIEKILFQTDNYAGFNYVEWMNGGYERWIEAGEPEGSEKFQFMYSKHGGEYARKYY